MKLSTFIAVSSTVSSFVAAVPLDARAIDIVTKTDVVITTIDITKTVWVDGPAPKPTGGGGAVIPQAQPSAPSVPNPPKHQHHHHHHQPAPLPAPAPAPATQAPAPTVAPAPQHSHKPKPAPIPHPSPSPAPSQSGGSGQTYSGDMTWYDVGLGSCGWTSTPNQNIVALSYKLMNNPANPNDNPLCGKMITIHYAGKTETAKVVDTCMGCEGIGDLDMSTGLFSDFASLGVGRITSGMSWSFN